MTWSSFYFNRTFQNSSSSSKVLLQHYLDPCMDLWNDWSKVCILTSRIRSTWFRISLTLFRPKYLTQSQFRSHPFSSIRNPVRSRGFWSTISLNISICSCQLFASQHRSSWTSIFKTTLDWTYNIYNIWRWFYFRKCWSWWILVINPSYSSKTYDIQQHRDKILLC